MGCVSANRCDRKGQLWKLKLQLCGYKSIFALLAIGAVCAALCLCIAVRHTRSIAQGPAQMQHQSETAGFYSGEYAYIDVTAVSGSIYRQPYSQHKDEAYFYEVVDAAGNPFLISVKTVTGHPILTSSFSCPTRITGCTQPLTEDVLSNIVENAQGLSLEQARKRYGYTMLNVEQRPGANDEVLWLLPVPWLLAAFLVWSCKSRGYSSSAKALKGGENTKLLADWRAADDAYRKHGILLGESFVYSLRDGSFFRYREIQDFYSGYDMVEKDPPGKRMRAALLEIALKDGRRIPLGRRGASKKVNEEIRAQLKAAILERIKAQNGSGALGPRV